MLTILSPNRTQVASRTINLVVVHDMEYPERLTAAEDVAAYFARPATRASAHVCADADSMVRCVPDHDVAWAAPGANSDGLQLELAGYARQTHAQWADEYSRRMLARAAGQVATWCQAYDVPVRYLTADELKAGKRGITTHGQVTAAYHESTHTDPGPAFPMDDFLALVRDRMVARVSAAAVRDAWAHDRWGRKGRHPAMVKQVQRALGVRATGVYGSRTRRVVAKRFPAARHGLLSRWRLQQIAGGRFMVED